MNRFVSVLAFVAVAIVGLAIGGFFNPAGHVAIGDSRIPAQFVAVVVLIMVTILAAAFGQVVPWNTWASKVRGAVTSRQTAVVKQATTDRTSELMAVSDIPVRVAHLIGCVHHLRCALKGDAEGQKLLDDIAIKVGRVSIEKSVEPEPESA